MSAEGAGYQGSRLRLAEPTEGARLMHELQRECAARGLRLSYLPVSVSYTGAKQGERRVYEDLEVSSRSWRIRLVPVSQELEQGRECAELLVLIDGTPDEAMLGLLRHLGEVPAAPIPDRPPVRPDIGEGLDAEHPSAPQDFSRQFRVLVIFQGAWGRRIAEHVRRAAPPSWTVTSLELAADLPSVIDDPGQWLPEVPGADLVLFLSENPSAGQLIP